MVYADKVVSMGGACGPRYLADADTAASPGFLNPRKYPCVRAVMQYLAQPICRKHYSISHQNLHAFSKAR
jgi:hypothetical protein